MRERGFSLLSGQARAGETPAVRRALRERGFSLLEMLVAVVIFLLISGAMFGLLNVAQQRYLVESQKLDAFQSARVALDQIARDIHDAGYPPVISAPLANPVNVAYPFAWDANYPADCNSPVPPAAGNCGRSPSGIDIVLESNADGAGVKWVRYALGRPGLPATAQVPTTLYRGVAPKQAGQNPVDATNDKLVPYVENVMNNAPLAQIAAIQAAYPGAFTNLPRPVFSWAFDTNTPGTNPRYIREVTITLVVQSESLDPRSGQPRVISLTGMARRFNPAF